MPRKKVEVVEKPDNTEKVKELQTKWLKLAPHEKLGKTKSITKRLDALEKEIFELL